MTEHATPVTPSARPLSLGRRIFLPSLADMLILALVAWLFMSTPDGWSLVLGDCDTGWHIRTGDYVLAHGEVPRRDLFSYSKAGEPWFAWEWGAGVILSLVHGAFGLKGVVLLAVTLLAAFGALLFRYLLWLGVNVLVALPITLVAFGATAVHHHARPHLFTLLLVPVAMWVLEADRRRPGRRVWLLVPLTVLWTNLHGGFLALISLIGLLAVGTFVEKLLAGERRAGLWRAPLRYAALGAACMAASLVNPYGAALHLHVADYLRSDWIRSAVQEFQSPRFRGEHMMFYQFLLFGGLMAALARLRRLDVVWPLWLLFWAHQSLGSARHITIYATLAAPVVAVELSLLWSALFDNAPARSVRRILSDMARDAAPSARYSSAWPALLLVFLLLPLPLFRWPEDFPARKFPAAMTREHGELLRQGRLLTSDQWADYLIYHHYPGQKVFFDGRSDFYGKQLGMEYLSAMNGRHDWASVFERHRFDTALVPVEWPLGSLLKIDPRWRLVADDGQALLFVREATADQPGGRPGMRAGVGKIPSSGLMNPPADAELNRGELIP